MPVRGPFRADILDNVLDVPTEGAQTFAGFDSSLNFEFNNLPSSPDSGGSPAETIESYEPATPSDRRARISVPPSLLSGPVLRPLIQTGGLLFPYTPTVIFGRAASYDDFHFTHSNYRYYQFQASSPSEIQINGDFTAMNDDEARYSLAAIRFLQSMTLSEFGKQSGKNRGVPPPVLRFNYLGEQIFRNVPVVITQFTINFEPDIDYVPVRGFNTHVPLKMLVTANLVVQQNPKRTVNEFSVKGFKSGSLIKKGYI